MPQFLDSPAAMPLAQVEPEESMSAYLREYRALGDDFHSAMTLKVRTTPELTIGHSPRTMNYNTP